MTRGEMEEDHLRARELNSSFMIHAIFGSGTDNVKSAVKISRLSSDLHRVRALMDAVRPAEPQPPLMHSRHF